MGETKFWKKERQTDRRTLFHTSGATFLSNYPLLTVRLYWIIVFSQAADSAQPFYKLDLLKLERKISCNFIPRLAGRLLPRKISAHDYSSWYNTLRHVWHVHKETPGSVKKQNKNSSHTMSCPVVIERPSWNSWGSTLTNQPEVWHQLPLTVTCCSTQVRNLNVTFSS